MKIKTRALPKPAFKPMIARIILYETSGGWLPYPPGGFFYDYPSAKLALAETRKENPGSKFRGALCSLAPY